MLEFLGWVGVKKQGTPWRGREREKKVNEGGCAGMVFRRH